MRLFDLHCDTVGVCYATNQTLKDNTAHVDLQRGVRYRPWCQVLAVWIPDTVRGSEAWTYCRKCLQYAHVQATEHPQALHLITTRGELKTADRFNGCIGILGVEGGGAIGGIERICELSHLGVRVITITWNGSNEWGNGCLSDDTSGLTALGKRAVAQMERYGIVVDVSHLNEAGFWDVAELATRPFIASHSLARAVYDHSRNLRDIQFRAIRDCGGIVGISLCGEHLGVQTWDRVYRHITHFWQMDGCDTVALGFDLDGTALPPSWNGIQAAERLAEYLLKHRVDEKYVTNLLFENAYRFFCEFFG